MEFYQILYIIIRYLLKEVIAFSSASQSNLAGQTMPEGLDSQTIGESIMYLYEVVRLYMYFEKQNAPSAILDGA